MAGERLEVRAAGDADLAAVLDVHTRAFGDEEGPEVSGLVAGLLRDGTAAPVLSLVAEVEERVVGHVLFTAAQVGSGASTAAARILAPLGVLPGRQRAGTGTTLVRCGLEQLAADGVDLVFVLGHPSYYPRFGFRPAGALGYPAPYPIPARNAEAWMVRELQAGALERFAGPVRCATAMDEARYWTE